METDTYCHFLTVKQLVKLLDGDREDFQDVFGGCFSGCRKDG